MNPAIRILDALPYLGRHQVSIREIGVGVVASALAPAGGGSSRVVRKCPQKGLVPGRLGKGASLFLLGQHLRGPGSLTGF